MIATTKNPEQFVLVFLKAPEKGKVKTRLVGYLDEDQVLRLYQCFAIDVIETVKKGTYRFRICYSPLEAETKITEWLGRQYDLMPQIGTDLGKRMDHAFCEAFLSGADQAVLIGTDLPDLTGKLIDQAFKSLDGHDVVIGPAIDGGYYLVGFKADAYLPQIFQNIPWGTSDVFGQTIGILKRRHLRVYVLPPWRDIDEIEDLAVFYRTRKNRSEGARNTIAYLQSIGFQDVLENKKF